MKKIALRVAAIIVFIFSLTGPMKAELSQNAFTMADTSSIDAVIVMDQSLSMRGQNTQSDPKDYRLDAAQMMISMCDTGSRVAFIPFAGEVLPYGDDEFVDLSDINARIQKLQSIGKLRGGGLMPDTDLGVALSKAVKLLLERKDKSNQPMIIVLTDGQNDIAKDRSGKPKTVLQWNESSEAFEEQNINKYTKLEADKLMNDSANVAMDYDIPIYTIALYDSNSKREIVNVYAGQLEQISSRTGGTSIKVSSADASKLPQFFGDMFAAQIGSNLFKGLEIIKVSGNAARYQVLLPILNQSVQEANIFIPLGSIQEVKGAPTVSLFDAGGNNVSGGSKDVIQLKSENFMLYKIIMPRTIGDWRLEFELKEGIIAVPAEISFSLLYNYNISLQTNIAKSISGLQQEAADFKFYKNEKIHIESLFYDIEGQPSSDTYLYKTDHDELEDDWKTIKATYEIIDPVQNNVVIIKGDMPVNRGRFAAEIDLKSAYMADGFNILRSGDYLLRIKTEGAGLLRKNEIPIEVLNSDPQAKSPILKIVHVDDPDDLNTQKVQDIEILLTGNIEDPDGDKLSFDRLTPLEDASQIINLKMDAPRPDDNVFVVGQTIFDEEAKLFWHGTARYTIHATDGDSGDTEIPIEVKVQSKTADVTSQFECVTAVDGIGSSQEVPKNSSVVFKMQLIEKETNKPDKTGKIESYSGDLIIYDVSNNNKILDQIKYSHVKDENYLEAVWTSPNKSHEISAVSNFVYGGSGFFAGKQTVDFSIKNAPPQSHQDALDKLPQTITFDPLPDVFNFLETPTPEEALQVRLDKLFSDQDNEAGPIFESLFLSHEDGSVNPDTIMTYTVTENLVQFQPTGEGTLTLNFAAVDGDEARAQITQTVRVESVLLKWQRYGVIALISLISFVILILIIRQARKPKYPHDGVLLIKENDALFPTDQYELTPTKKFIPFNHVINDELAQKYGISDQQLANLMLRPVRSANGSVAVFSRKKLSGLSVQIEGEDVGKKFVLWEKDQELVFKASGYLNQLKLQFTREQSENSDDSDHDFYHKGFEINHPQNTNDSFDPSGNNDGF